MVNFNSVQKIHKKFMYHDKCDIYKFEAQTNPNGSKSTKKQKVPVYIDVPCKISFSLRTWDTFTHKNLDTTPYEKQPKVFLENKYKVLPGYYLEAHKCNPDTKEIIYTYNGQAGLSQICWTHQEILLDVKGDC